MTRYSPDTSVQAQSIQINLALSLEERYGVHFTIFGAELVLTGHVPNYEAKCRIEAAARVSGYRIQNCLKVTPSLGNVSWPSTPQQ